MTNEDRIYKLCEYVMDLVDTLSYHNRDYQFNTDLSWVKDEVKSIQEDIDGR